MGEKLFVQGLKSIRVRRSLGDDYDAYLYFEGYRLVGIHNGRSFDKVANIIPVYELVSYIESLELVREKVFVGNSSKSQTRITLYYENGSALELGMNLTEEGLDYLKLDPEELLMLLMLWARLVKFS